MLQVIYPRNQPLYQEKLLHLMRIIVLILNKEISIFMGESYLKYKGLFVDFTSDFWWDPTHKKSFGACIYSFMEDRYTL